MMTGAFELLGRLDHRLHRRVVDGVERRDGVAFGFRFTQYGLQIDQRHLLLLGMAQTPPQTAH